MDRTSLTPGKLYARLSAEFRMLRPGTCSCNVPLPYVVERSDPHEANWELGSVPPACENCRATIEEVVNRALAHYDVYDPTAAPVRRRH